MNPALADMPARDLATLLRRLGRAPDLESAAEDAATSLCQALEADVAVVEFPGWATGDRVVALAGTLVPTTRLRDLRAGARRAGIAAWLRRRGVATVRSVAAPVDPHRPVNLTVGWRQPREVPAAAGEWLALVADQSAMLVGHLEVTRALQVERERRLAIEDELVRSQHLRAVGEIAAGVIHDVNNGLTTVVGLTDWLLISLPADARGRRELESVRIAAEDCAAVLRRFHEFGRSGSTIAPAQLVDLSAIVTDVAELARPRTRRAAECAGTPVEITVETVPVPPVVASASEIRELLMNLVLNAFDAMPSGGQLCLRTSTSGGEVLVSVRDSGIGMSDDVRARIFDPYFTTKGTRGTGLGLAVGRLIAERNGGRLDVSSAAGRGSTFTLSLPSVDSAIALPPPMLRVDHVESPSGLRILLVDDEPDVRQSVGGMLSGMGHLVDCAADGREALRLARRRPFDVVITDLGMPAMTGIELATRLRELVPTRPIILLTGWAGEFDRQRPDGIAMVQAKPVTMRQLAVALATVTNPLAA